MLFETGVDVFDHRGEGRGLAATRGAGQQHDAARRFRDFLQNLEQPQFLEAGDFGFHVAHGQTVFASLLKQVRPKPAQAGNKVGEIRLMVLLQPLFQVPRDDRFHHFVDPLQRRRGRFDGHEAAVDPENDGCACLEMNVGRASVNGGLQNTVKDFHAGRLTEPAWIRPVENTPAS